MRVIVEGTPLVLKASEVIGQGGEAVVYRRGDRALKIYQGLDRAALGRKADKLAHYPGPLPPAVLAPLAPALDEHGALVGFAMRYLAGAVEARKLTSRTQRLGVVDAAGATRWLIALAAELRALHGAGVVVGDLNDGNVLCANGAPYLIDADSYQFAGHACTVAHERYLDPRLYGVDLTRTAALDQASDWYAFSVLAFSVLLLVHPYGGAHPTLGTLLRRAEARVSVLRPEVTRPKISLSAEVLPRALVSWFEATFDGGLREPLPVALLQLPWTTCGCGLEHARAACPACAARGVVQARPAIRHHGRVRWVSLQRLEPGARVRASRVAGSLRYLVEEPSGALVREDGAVVRGAGSIDGAAFTGRTTWLVEGASVVSVEAGAVRARRTVGTSAGTAAFDANSRGAYYADGDYLIDGLDETRVGTILEGATTIQVGERLGVGHYRAGRLTHHFLFRVGRPGLVELALPTIEGRLLAYAAYFDEGHALVAWHASSGGTTTAHLHLIDAAGRVVASRVGAPDSSPILAGTGGFALAGGRVLRATDGGVLGVEADRSSRTLVAGALFTDTEPFVAEGYEILPGPGGSLYVVTETEVGQLCLA